MRTTLSTIRHINRCFISATQFNKGKRGIILNDTLVLTPKIRSVPAASVLVRVLVACIYIRKLQVIWDFSNLVCYKIVEHSIRYSSNYCKKYYNIRARERHCSIDNRLWYIFEVASKYSRGESRKINVNTSCFKKQRLDNCCSFPRKSYGEKASLTFISK